jgi:hypothetical protein
LKKFENNAGGSARAMLKLLVFDRSFIFGKRTSGWPLAPKRVTVIHRLPKMNALRIIFAVLAIVLLIVSSLSLNPHDVQSAILALVCFFFGLAASRSYEPDKSGFAELAAAPRLLATRAPPLS